mmetsp:Transcript_1588/g.4080  ORF Transcript_1588/g.4080 Transcript_1588/m.4080 type:complete len:216 (+) Transcript_1588:176-823(+)
MSPLISSILLILCAMVSPSLFVRLVGFLLLRCLTIFVLTFLATSVAMPAMSLPFPAFWRVCKCSRVSIMHSRWTPIKWWACIKGRHLGMTSRWSPLLKRRQRQQLLSIITHGRSWRRAPIHRRRHHRWPHAWGAVHERWWHHWRWPELRPTFPEALALPLSHGFLSYFLVDPAKLIGPHFDGLCYILHFVWFVVDNHMQTWVLVHLTIGLHVASG